MRLPALKPLLQQCRDEKSVERKDRNVRFWDWPFPGANEQPYHFIHDGATSRGVSGLRLTALLETLGHPNVRLTTRLTVHVILDVIAHRSVDRRAAWRGTEQPV
jgi:hypothetical protein